MSTSRKFLYAAATVAACVLLLEGGARLLLLALGPGEAPLRVGFRQEATTLFRPDPELFFRLHPGLRIERAKNSLMIDVRTNSLGLRGPELSPLGAAGALRILAIGDSCTFGSGAATDQTYPAQLQQILRASHPQLALEVVNAGVPGYSSYQVRRYLELQGYRLAPHVVLIAVGFNDAAEARPTGKRSFAGDLWLSDAEYADALRRGPRLGITRLARRLQSAPGPADPPNGTRPAKTRVSGREYRENLTAMVEGCRSRGILPIVIVWPMATQAGLGQTLERQAEVEANQRSAREVARARGVPLVDLEPLLAPEPRLFLDQIHLQPEGYAAVARAIADELVRHPPLTGPAPGAG